jgi:hypothetical protein
VHLAALRHPPRVPGRANEGAEVAHAPPGRVQQRR